MKTQRHQHEKSHLYNSLVHTNYYVLAGFITTTLLTGLFLSSSITSATDDSVIDEVNITVPISCSLSGNGMNTHNANIVNGTYTADIGTTTLKAFCNDNAGFAIYATGYTGNEIGATNSNKLVGTNASSNATIVTGLATSTPNPDESNWAMKLTASSDSGDTSGTNALTIDSAPNIINGTPSQESASFSGYHTVPNEYTKVAHKNSATSMDETTGGATLTSTYAAYISKTQPADTYTGQVIYTLVHPSDAGAPPQPQQATAGCINYFANTSNAVGTMGCQSATDGNTITLLASNFSRDGYGFAGWSDKFDYATNQNAKFYGPNEDITVPEGTTANGLALYAVWIKSQGNLQDSSKVASVCSNLTTAPTDGTANLNSVSALTDQRDNQTYAIAKLADGNCWMIENMRLENTGTDNTNGSLAQGYNASFAGLADPEGPSLFFQFTTANTLYSTDGSTDKTISGNYQANRFPRYNNVNTPTTVSDRPSNPTANSSTNSTSNAGMYSYGNYYTWHAAIADTTHYSTNNQSVTSTSICPTGWHLPKGGNNQNTANNEFLAFSEALIGVKPANYDSRTLPYYTGTPEGTDASNALRAYPNNFVYSGEVGYGSVNSRGSDGYYWSSTASSDVNVYGMGVSSSVVFPGTGSSYKYTGSSIRCLAPGA